MTVRGYSKVDWVNHGNYLYLVDVAQGNKVSTNELVARYNSMIDELEVALSRVRAAIEIAKQIGVQSKAMEIALGKDVQ